MLQLNWNGTWEDIGRWCKQIVIAGFTLATPRARELIDSPRQTCSPFEVEDYPSGYPQFSALVGSDSSFFICRRFTTLRARLLLQKQDRISALERQLHDVDEQEQCALFLGSLRRDQNEDRARLLASIDAALQDYDNYLERTDRVCNLKTARPRNTSNLRNWVEYTGSIAREETEFLTTKHDLISPIRSEDSALTPFQEFVEDLAIRFKPLQKLLCRSGVSRDSDIHIFTAAMVGSSARFIVTSLIAISLLVPVAVIDSLGSNKAKTITTVISCAVFVLVLPSFMKTNTKETVIAGTTYATVLVVFITGNGITTS